MIFVHFGYLGKCDVLLLLVEAFKAASLIKRRDFVTDIRVLRKQIAPQFLIFLHEQEDSLLIAIFLVIELKPHYLVIDSLKAFVWGS